MDKLLLLGVVLSLQLSGLLGEPYIVRSPDIANGEFLLYIRFPQPEPNHETISPATQHSLNNHAKSINDLTSAPARDTPTELSNSVDAVGEQLSSENHVTKGIGSYKLHLRKLSWDEARKVCIDEGGHLGVIKSSDDESLMTRSMDEKGISRAWIGYHDLFKSGEWTSVLDEPLVITNWSGWSPVYHPNPSGGKQHCSQLLVSGGIDDLECSHERAFICKLTT